MTFKNTGTRNNDEFSEEPTTKSKLITIKEPSLDHEEKLYIRAYLSTLSHHTAYKTLNPSSTAKHYNNKFSRRPQVEYHINKEMLSRTEALNLSPEVILAKLYEEATFRGQGSQHGSRITALTTLGKHLGLFHDKAEKKEEVTYNIINYNSSEPATEPTKTIESIESGDKLPVTMNSEVLITKYSEDPNTIPLDNISEDFKDNKEENKDG